MFNKKIIFPVLAALGLLLVGCSGGGGSNPSDSTGGDSITSEPGSEAQTYEVTFNTKGGSAVRKQTVKEGEKATRPNDPTKGGNKFVDWYLEDSYETVYDFNTPVTSSFTLYAKWALSTDSTLIAQVNYYSTDDSGVEIAMFDEAGLKLHNINGWVGEGLTHNMSWRTIMIVDAQGRLAFGVHCPANGYGNPSEYSYVSNEYYGPSGVGYTNNPAIVLGNSYNSNSNDFELVIPEGGFAVTGHTNGANAIYTMITGDTNPISSEGADFELAESRGRAFNKTHGEWSTRTFSVDKAKSAINVYDLATHVTYSGDFSGAFVGDAETATYTKTVKLTAGKKVAFAYFNGVLSIPVVPAGYTFEGDYGAENGLVLDEEVENTLLVTKTGNYTLTLNVNTNTFTITREAVNDFKINLVDIVGTVPAYIDVEKGGEYTLPTPTNIPAGYTFLGWVDGSKNDISLTGTFNGEEDVTYYACYEKESTKVAYAGSMAGLSVDADAQLSVWSENTILHDKGAWLGNGWRMYAVVDAEGRLAYAVMYPPNGYGGPDGYSYMCHDHYKATGVGYAGNPAIEVLDGYGPWEPGGTAHNQFIIKVPEGGFAITAHGTDVVKLVSLLTNNAFPGFDGTNEGQYEALINSSENVTNNTVSYDKVNNIFYSSLF